MGSITDRNGMALTEAEDIKKRWQEYTEGLYKKDLHDPDNHDGVITDLEPDILECELKWALESITTNKARGGDANSSWALSNPKRWSCESAQYVSKFAASTFGKLSSGHSTWKVSFHSNLKERQCQRMFKLPHHCIHLTLKQSNAQNSTWTENSRCSSWI